MLHLYAWVDGEGEGFPKSANRVLLLNVLFEQVGAFIAQQAREPHAISLAWYVTW